MNEERDAFERAYSSIFERSANFATNEDGQYKDAWVFIGRSLWAAALEWQAARQSAEIEALIADNASLLDSLNKEANARCELEDKLARQSASVADCPHGVDDGACKQCYAEKTGQTPAMTTPSIAVDPIAPPLTMAPIAQPAESKRVELTDDTIEVVTVALRRAWQLGQTYWQQADSDSYKQQDKSDETRKKFEDLVDKTRELLARAQAKGK